MESAEIVHEIVPIDHNSEDVQNITKTELEQEYQFIPVQLIQSSSNVGPVSPKGKYYKQTYRPAWEHMPDFKGWLRGVEGEPTRAFCTYCHKTLHAHRLSLLKHTCTIRHQKAAQLHNSRKGKLVTLDMKANLARIEDDEREASNHEDTEMENEDEDDDDEEDEENFKEDDGTNDATHTGRELYESADVKENMSKSAIGKPPISTQVTDTTTGKPISGLQVSLYKLIDGRWTFINEGLTNTLGRFSQFLDRDGFSTGRYKLHYDVDRYFETKKQDTIYPFIEIVFDAGQYMDSQHITLLLSPFGYTTYKGC